MDIENIWQQVGDSEDDLNRLLNTRDFSTLRSQSPLKKLKQNLLIGMIWALMINVGYIVLLVFVSIWQVNVALGVLIVFNTLIILDSWRLYQQTPAAISPSNSLREELTLHYTSFQRWWKVQQNISLFVFPIAAAGGFI